MSDEPRNLDERKATILRAVVEEYIDSGQPVGSGHVVGSTGIKVSPATVRNDMATLEQEGYVFQPHTSAGRVPTEKGYRFFVDGLEPSVRLGTTETKQVRAFFDKAHGELEQMLQDTSRLLSDLTRYTAVVVGPPHEAATIRSVQLVGIAPRVAVLVMVLSNGAVEKRTVEFDRDVDEITLADVGERLGALFVGKSLADVAGIEVPEGDPLAAELAVVVGAVVGSGDDDPEVYIGGTSQMAAAFDAVSRVREVLDVLEQQFVVVTLLRDVLDRGLNVAIGTETGMEPLADCAVVVAPYEVEGERAGSIGVLGPARMHYPQALAAVAVVSRRLGNRLSEG